MASENSVDISTEIGSNKSTSEAPQRQRRGRGGLGRGLGALIPDSEAEAAPQPGRPLDILFPDLRGAQSIDVAAEAKPRKRGGSARELLEPRSSGRNVSRETLKGRKGGSARSVVPNPADSAPVETEPPTAIPVPEQVPDTDRRAKRARTTVSSRRTSSNGRPASGDRAEQTPDRTGTDSRGNDVATAVVEGEIVSRETIPSDPSGFEAATTELQEVPGATFGLIPTNWIIPNLKQPRHVFDPDDLKELSASIAEVGVLQPIVLRRITDLTLVEEGQWERLREALKEQPEARYEIIMGERRWRASQMAGLKEIPAIIRVTEEDDLLRDALIENLHRVQLNPLEEAAAYSQLMEDFACTQEELSRRVARSRPQIANTLRLLKLPPSVQRQVAAGVLSAGHARALLSLDSPGAMEALAKRIIQEGLSVRATEEQVKFGKQGKSRPKRLPPQPSLAAQRVADAVADLLETSVSVSAGAKRGKLIIEFADQSDLDRIAAALGADLN